MEERETSRRWTGQTDGTSWMQRALIAMLRVVDVRVLYGVMAVVVPFYMMFNRRGYRSMREYFRHHGYRGLQTVWHIYRNHYIFGQIVIDRFAVFAGKRYKFCDNGKEVIDQYLEKPGGFVMLSSHVGNYEIVGCTLNARQKKINALVYGGETETIMAHRRRLMAEHNIELITAGGDMSHVLKMNAAINAGEVMSMHADRLFGSTKYIECLFLGENAAFPMGPFAFAAQKEVPVFAVFLMKVRTKEYRFVVKELKASEQKNARGRAEDLARQYAAVLENVIKEYPYQWFNYFDFWRKER